MFKRLRKFISLMEQKKARLLILISIIVFNLVLWVITSSLAYFIDPTRYGNFFNALLTSGLSWIIDPGSYETGSSTDMAIRIMSLVTIIVSMVTFSGGIIAYVASWLSSFFDRSEEGTHKLFVYDHILILNWNIKALELIADYASAKGAIDVVIVSEHDRKTIEESIANRLYESKKEGQTNRINVIVIKGNVFSKQVLDRVCLTAAKSVIILSDVKSTASSKGHSADINALKTLMLVTRLSTNPNQTVIVEVTTDETRHLILDQICADQADKSRVIPLLSDELMGKLISQILVSPSLVHVYSQLMVTDGAEFYPTEHFDPLEFAKTHDHAIPIYQSTNKLYVIAEKHEDIHKVRKEPLVAIPDIKIVARTETRPISLVIFGKNNKLHFILDSMHALESDCNIKSKVILIESDDIETIRKSIADIPSIDTILLLSDEHLPKDELDSKVLITLLLIQDIEKLKNANVIVELLDPRHLDIAQSYRIQHTLISNRYISHMMAHISKNRELFDIYNDLLTYDEPDSGVSSKEFYAYKANYLFDATFPLVFASKALFVTAVCQASKGDFLVLGIIRNDVLEIFGGNIDQGGPLTLQPDDIIAVVAY